MRPTTTKAVRALRDALVEVRDGQVLGAKRKAHLDRAITHITHCASDVADEKLPSVDEVAGRSRQTEKSDTNTPMGSRSLQTDLRNMRVHRPKQRPATAEQIAWDVVRLKGTR